MKRILLFIIWAIIGSTPKSQGQTNYSDDFTQTHTICTTPPSFLYPDNSYPQWKWGWSHGSPSSNGDEIFMWHNVQNTGWEKEGEGIFSNLTFFKGSKYKIYLKVSSFKTNISGNGKIHMLLSSARSNTACPPNNGDPIPTFSPNLTLLDFTTSDLADVVLEIAFITPNNQDFNSLVIFPEDLSTGTPQVELLIDCIYIYSCNNDTQIYDDIIPDGNIARGIYYVGSTYGSVSSLVVNSSGPTLLTATNSTLFSENTLISVDDRSSFTANIEICPNEDFDDEDFGDEPILTIIKNQEDFCGVAPKPNTAKSLILNTSEIGDFKVSYIPFSNVVNIRSDINENVILKLFSSDGRQLLVRNFTNNYFTLDLSNYPSGIYIMQLIQRNGSTKCEKIMVY